MGEEMRLAAARLVKFAESGDWGEAARDAAYAGHRWPDESLIADLKSVACPLLPELDERPLTPAMAALLTRTEAQVFADGSRRLVLVSNPGQRPEAWDNAWTITISREGAVFADIEFGDFPIKLFKPTVGQFFTACRLAGVTRTVAEAEWRKLRVAVPG